jgi:hypothetical protein
MAKSREQRIANGEIVPNSFQHPNIYEDWLAYYLTPQEHVVLGKAIREILGWEDKIAERKARIALSIFVDGKTNAAGDQLCLGCGLSLQAVRKALEALDCYGILRKEGTATQDGQMFYLQDDTGLIDWDGLARRRERWDRKNTQRTRKATEASLEARGITSDVTPNVTRYPKPSGVTSDVTQGVASDIRPGGTSDVGSGVTSDVNKETHNETQKETKKGDSQDLWSAALSDLQLQMAPETYNQHLRGTTATVAHENGTVLVTVHAAGDRSADILDHRLRPVIERTLARVAGEPVAVRFVGEGA